MTANVLTYSFHAVNPARTVNNDFGAPVKPGVWQAEDTTPDTRTTKTILNMVDLYSGLKQIEFQEQAALAEAEPVPAQPELSDAQAAQKNRKTAHDIYERTRNLRREFFKKAV